ncbi:hypothetical protein SAMN05428970_1139 [Agromyces sp. CF514]|uniref:hypothetical protein n=1 Tax=Agromyces sp. CF514 TaxID=1881031 RepID=UPI0008F21967|nr:hypothetical protein [Agromyces sp. CF514]SFR71201.1 hypothetical protein SAMN05428970_1139 [Agromyces sp. CF514]
MEDVGVEPGESTEEHGDIDVAPPRTRGLAASVWISLGLVGSLVVSIVLVVNGEGRYAFQGMDSSANLTNAIVAMSIALGVPLSVIVAWMIRHRQLGKQRRMLRRAPLVTALVCLVIGSTTVAVVASAVRRVDHDAVVAFQESLDPAAVEAEGLAHLAWMAERLELAVLGEPEVRRESCVLADSGRGVAPVVTIEAHAGGVAAQDLPRVALSFWRAEGYDPNTDNGSMAYLSGVPLEDPYTEILVVRDSPETGVHELSYHAVCMQPAP